MTNDKIGFRCQENTYFNNDFFLLIEDYINGNKHEDFEKTVSYLIKILKENKELISTFKNYNSTIIILHEYLIDNYDFNSSFELIKIIENLYRDIK